MFQPVVPILDEGDCLISEGTSKFYNVEIAFLPLTSVIASLIAVCIWSPSFKSWFLNILSKSSFVRISVWRLVKESFLWIASETCSFNFELKLFVSLLTSNNSRLSGWASPPW